MKFTAVVGNPPYQENNVSTNFSSAIFHKFIDAGQAISDTVLYDYASKIFF